VPSTSSAAAIADRTPEEPPGERRQGHAQFLWIPVALGATAAVILFALCGSGAETDLAAAALAGAGMICGRYLLARVEAERTAWSARQSDTPRQLDAAMTAVFPLWRRQIETCRGIGDGSVAAITGSFAEMVNRLDATAAASRDASTMITESVQSIVGVLERSESDLAGVVETLRALQTRNDRLLGQLGGYARNLGEMAADVQQVALQMRLLSLNGAIEASRAGERGKAFAVVVGQMQELSSLSSETGARIAKELETVNQALSDVPGGDRDAHTERDESTIARAERDIEAVMGRFKGLTGGLTASVGVLDHQSAAIKAEISEALVRFQFQDRVSQILGHVSDGIDELATALAKERPQDAISDAAVWLDRATDKYTTDEEFRNLRDTRVGAPADAAVQYF
jgi:methyl-accepting chemotaxis protein